MRFIHMRATGYALTLLVALIFASFTPGTVKADSGEMDLAISLLNQGEDNLDIGALKRAEELFHKNCEGPARNPYCEYYLARVYIAQYGYFSRVSRDNVKAEKALHDAETAALEAVNRRPGDAAAYVILGKVRQLQLNRSPLSGITAAAISESPVASAYEKALKLDPNNGEAEMGLGIYYQFIPRVIGGDGHRAREHFKRAAKLMPEDPDPLVWVAISYREEGRLDDARKWMDKAIQVAPDNAFVKRENRRLKEIEEAAG